MTGFLACSLACFLLALGVTAVPARADGPPAIPVVDSGAQAPAVLRDQQTRRRNAAVETQRRQRATDERLRYAELRAKLARINLDYARLRRDRDLFRKDTESPLQWELGDRVLADRTQAADTASRNVDDAAREIRAQRRLKPSAVGATHGLRQLYLDSLR